MARRNLLKGFKKPKGIVFEHSEIVNNYGKFVAYPFERGYGTTIGNTLRRILLSSIQGYAISAIRITRYNEDSTSTVVSNEFESIPEFVEDMPEVINNFKRVQLKLNGELEEKTVLVECKGEGELIAGDLAVDDDIEICNKELHIVTLTKNANVEIELQISTGCGYVSAETNEKYIDIIGTIPIDSIYSPIIKARYAVEGTRVDQRADYDKLTFELWTDGSISPEDALAEAAKIAKDHFTLFINFDEDEVSPEDEIDDEEERIRQLLDTPIEELELSVRSSNCLKNANIRTIGDLTRRTEEDIAKTKNFGKKSLQEIKLKLEDWNLTFGMKDFSAVKAMKGAKKLQLNKKDESDET